MIALARIRLAAVRSRKARPRLLLEPVKVSEALRDALREAYELTRTGESGEPLRETLHDARDLLDLANETLAGDPQAGEHARGMALHMAEQLAAVEFMLGPIAAG